MYTDDLVSGKHKVIKSQEQKDRYCSFLRGHIDRRVDGINLVNEKLIQKLNGISAGEWNLVEKYTFDSAEEGALFNYGLIDANGQIYMTNFMETYPTDMVLNLKNKGKPTAPLAPNLRDEVITKVMIS